MLKFVEQVVRNKQIRQTTRFVGASAVDQVERVQRFGRGLLRAIAKVWAFFKDIHFSWYVIVPVISSTSALGDAATVLAWGAVAALVLALLAFTLFESILPAEGHPRSNQAANPHTKTRAPILPRADSGTVLSHRSRATYGPLQTRWSRQGLSRAPRRSSHSRKARD